MRILGIDFGTKSIGLAVSDEMGLTGQAIGTIKRKNIRYDLDEIQKYIKKYGIKKIVIGLPKNMDGSLGKSAEDVVRFAESIKARLCISVDTWDERLSTVEAEKILLSADVSRKKRKRVIDKVAAAIILQSYLNYLRNSNIPVL